MYKIKQLKKNDIKKKNKERKASTIKENGVKVP